MADMIRVSAAELRPLKEGFFRSFGTEPTDFYSAPGRTEIGGNHTDHQRGRVLAAAVDLDSRMAVRLNGTTIVRIQSEGYPLCLVDLEDLTPHQEEINTTPALIRGVLSAFAERGCKLSGFDAYCASTVLPGSGLSSSAAFEVLVGTAVNELFNGGRADAPTVAKIAQYAENVFFGKPSGLMDQMASSVGGLVAIDFFEKESPVIRPLGADLSSPGYALCIIDSGADHADLTDEYAAIPKEMGAVCGYFGKTVLTEVPEADFYAALPALRQQFGDRAVLRCIHFYEETERVLREAAALERGDFALFLKELKESGYSSWMYLQNVIPAGNKTHQEMAISLALCHRLLGGRGGFRVHGGGFAGTVQAFVPEDLLEDFKNGIDTVLGAGACHVLSIRKEGGAVLREEA